MFLIVALVLLFLLPYPWNLVGFVVGVLVFVGEVLFWNGRVRHKPVRTGAGTLVGKTGTVRSPCTPRGQVQVGGEIWEARCEAGAERGDRVVVLAVEGIRLVVERAGTDTRRGGGSS